MEYEVVVKRNTSDELMHHKYVKREKVKGKWKYWYEDVKDKLGVDEREALKDKEKALDQQISKTEKSELEKKKSDIRLKYDGDSSEVQTENKKANLKLAQDKDKTNRIKKQVKDLEDKYANTPIGKVENAIEAGVRAVDKLLGISSRKNKEENEKKAEKEREELFRVARDERWKAAKREEKRLEEEARRKKELSEYYRKEREKYEAEIKKNQSKNTKNTKNTKKTNNARRRGLR